MRMQGVGSSCCWSGSKTTVWCPPPPQPPPHLAHRIQLGTAGQLVERLPNLGGGVALDDLGGHGACSGIEMRANAANLSRRWRMAPAQGRRGCGGSTSGGSASCRRPPARTGGGRVAVNPHGRHHCENVLVAAHSGRQLGQAVPGGAARDTREAWGLCWVCEAICWRAGVEKEGGTSGTCEGRAPADGSVRCTGQPRLAGASRAHSDGVTAMVLPAQEVYCAGGAGWAPT